MIQTNKNVSKIDCKCEKASKVSGVFSEPTDITSHREASHSASHSAVTGHTVRILLRTASAVRDEGLCHFENWNRKRNQFFMKILGFAWAFANPHSKRSGNGRRPEVWAASATKPTQHLINPDHMSEPARDAASSLAQWDNNALPWLSHRIARAPERKGIVKAEKRTLAVMWLMTLRFPTIQGQNVWPVTASII